MASLHRTSAPNALLSLALAAILVGCGSSSSPTPTAAGTGPSSSAAGTAAAGGSAADETAGASATTASGAGPGASAVPSAVPSASGSVGGGIAGDLQQAFVSVVHAVAPSVVVIETPSGLGSGVVFDDKGDVVTNAHVVGSDTQFKVTTAAGDRLDATLVGTFPPNDLAVIHTSGGTLTPATFGDSSALVVGDIVLAIGNPLGLQSSVTEGIVSATGRTVSEPGGAALPNVIQTSAPINPGNSGGALVNLAGEVVGIPTLTATDPQIGGAAVGIGFAIPSNTTKDIATQLIEHGKVVSSHRAYLGIRGAEVQGGQGVLVYSVEPGGPAAKANVPSDVLITSIDGKPTPDLSALAAVLAGLEPGQTVKVDILRRDGSTDSIDVKLGELPG
ncbi:MAG TPA: trypsin-like peptidase domain-containing protein [Candidatus Limnocylindrales bacterium]|nr:trypsin-like peptidase domain-containing protein [Candidatus Limnocylindrales bacterium]